jgi:hypothetical protein
MCRMCTAAGTRCCVPALRASSRSSRGGPGSTSRRRLVIRVRELLDSDAVVESSIRTPQEAFSRLSRWPERFFAGLASAASESAGELQLENSIQDLVELRAELRVTPRLRPWIVTWNGLVELVDRFVEVARGFTSSLGEDVPLTAQQFAAQAQRELDAAADPMALVGERLARWSRLADFDSPSEVLVALVGEAYDVTAAEDVLSLDAAGAHLFRQPTSRGDMPAGLGVGLRLTELQVDAVLDPARFWMVSRHVSHRLIARGERLAALALKETWISDMREAAARGADAAEAGQVLLAAARRSRQEIAAVVGLIHELSEGPVRRYLAMVTAVSSGLDYERQRFSDLASVAQRAGQADFVDVVSGLDLGLRGAKAHEEFELEGQHILLGRRPHQLRMSIDDLIDRALSTIETHLALATGIFCAAATVGADLDFLDPLTGLDLEQGELVRVVAAFVGLSDVTVESVSPDLSVRATASQEPEYHFVPMFLPYLPDSTEAGHIQIALPHETIVLSGPFGPLRLWSTGEGLGKEAAFVEARARWTRDSEPWMSTGEVRRWTAIKAAEALEKPLAQGIANLRTLRTLAEKVSDDDLAEALKAAMAASRSKAIGLPPDPGVASGMYRLAQWMAN